jgi:hypothetical protein
MTDLYYEYRWVVFPEDIDYVIDTLFANPEELDYDIRTFTGLLEIPTPEGYLTLTLVLRVPSQDVFDEFIQKYAKKIGMTSWYRTSNVYFKEGVNPYYLVYPDKGDYLASIWEQGRYNEQLRKKLSNRAQD